MSSHTSHAWGSSSRFGRRSGRSVPVNRPSSETVPQSGAYLKLLPNTPSASSTSTSDQPADIFHIVDIFGVQHVLRVSFLFRLAKVCALRNDCPRPSLSISSSLTTTPMFGSGGDSARGPRSQRAALIPTTEVPMKSATMVLALQQSPRSGSSWTTR